MSLINQMLHDLEQRRVAGMAASPPGGVRAIGSATQSVRGSINYMTLTIIVMVIFASGVMVAYLLGNQQQAVVTPEPEKETPFFATDATGTVSENTKTNVLSAMMPSVKNSTVKTMEEPDFLVVVETKTVEVINKEPFAERTISTPIKPDVEKIMGSTPVSVPVSAGKSINKVIRPLTDDQQSQLAFQRALHMLSRNNQQGALLALEEALSFSPTHLRARETLAALLLNTGRVNEAASSLHEGLQLTPDAAPLAKLYARILVDQGDVVTAVALLEQARPTVAIDLEYHALLAALYQQVEKYAQAARAYQHILLQRPGMAVWWMGLGLAQDAMGETTAALSAFQRAQHTGGLGGEVLKYIQARIVALTPVVPVLLDISHDLDEFED